MNVGSSQKCPKCRSEIARRSRDGLLLKCRYLLLADGLVIACKTCGARIEPDGEVRLALARAIVLPIERG